MNLFDVYQLKQLNLCSAKGAWVYDSVGQKYLDFYGGHGVISVGHSHEVYIENISDQLNKIVFYSNSVVNSLQNEFAELLGEKCGYPDYQLFLCNSGAESVENALKIASFATKRKKVICFTNAFHGRTAAALNVSDYPAAKSSMNQEYDIIRLPLNDIPALENEMDDSICAVIIEGIQGLAGIYLPELNFLQTLRFLCDQYGAKLIIDEVQSGYGRTGKFFAHQHWNIQADIITIAKGMGNGFPIAGVIIHPSISPFKGMLGTTFGGNYLACQAGISVLQIIEQENLISNALNMGTSLIDQLGRLNGIKEIRGLGLMIAIELMEPARYFSKKLLDQYQILVGLSKCPNTIRLLPPLSINAVHVEYFMKAIKMALNDELKD